jgi:transcriptional regulator with XRE-family HTH domain
MEAASVTPIRLQIRPLREAKGWSQAELARQSDVPQSTISRLEGGDQAAVNLAHLERMADALGVNAGALLLHVPKGKRG